MNANSSSGASWRHIHKSAAQRQQTSGLRVQNQAGTVEGFTVRGDGVIKMLQTYSTTSGGAANVYLASDGILYRSTSSLKYKTDVQPFLPGLAEVLKMNPVSYVTKKDSLGRRYAGLIAEDIHELGLNEFVEYANDGTPDALMYANMVTLLINSVKELHAEIEKLKSKII